MQIHTSAGATKYVGGTVTETTGKDISGDAIVVGFGTADAPPAQTDGVAPTVDVPGATSASRVVKLLVDSSTPAQTGSWLWAWIADAPEVEPVRLQGPIFTD